MFLLIAGCANGRPIQSAGQVLAPAVTLTLPSAPAFDDQMVVTQLVQARYADRHFVFQSVVQVGPEQVTVVISMPSGPRVMRIEWRAGSVSVQKEAAAPPSLVPERLLADLMLVYASSDILREAIHGAQLVEGSGAMRRIVSKGQNVITVTRPEGDPWQGNATLKNYAFNYELSIMSQRAGQ
jgi:hypothetical protein